MNQDVGLDNKINLLNVAWISPEINPRHSFHDGIADTLQKVVGGLAYGTYPCGIGLQVKLTKKYLMNDQRFSFKKTDKLTKVLR